MTRGRPGPPGALAPSSGPSLHTTPDWDRRRPWRWLGNYEKLASSGCPSLRMKPTLDKSYSPCSEGYSCVTTRYRDQELPVDRGSASTSSDGLWGSHGRSDQESARRGCL